MYAYHLCEALGMDVDDGVVRVSLVHYNTDDEVDRLVKALEEGSGLHISQKMHQMQKMWNV